MISALLASAHILGGSVGLPAERPLLVSFYQLDCAPCIKQLKNLDCWSQHGWTVLPVGIGSDAAKLKQKHRLYVKESLPPQIVSLDQAQASGISGTPRHMLWRSNTAEAVSIEGFLSCPAVSS